VKVKPLSFSKYLIEKSASGSNHSKMLTLKAMPLNELPLHIFEKFDVKLKLNNFSLIEQLTTNNNNS